MELIETEKYQLVDAATEEDIALYWRWWKETMLEPARPGTEDLRRLTDADMAYFFGPEYHDNIMKLYRRAVDPMRITYLCRGGEKLGMASWLTYHSEDGECFILEFHIREAHRNAGLGSLFFERLRERAAAEGATYMALNLSNADNLRFWSRHGFVKARVDDWGVDVYERRPI